MDKYNTSRAPSPLDPKLMPKHVAIIMDGNGRWAAQRHQPRVFGHRKGADRVRETVEAAGKWGIEQLTLFAFSEENWARPPAEVDAIMRLLRFYIEKEKENLNKNNVRLAAIGNLDRLPEYNRKLLADAIDYLQGNTGLTLTIALSYSGRSELTNATKQIALAAKRGDINPEEIDEKLLDQFLETRSLADPDLLIRTSGELRISNFLLWQMAYTELYFTDTLWPDFGAAQFSQALCEFQVRDRRYGKVKHLTPGGTTEHAQSSESSLC